MSILMSIPAQGRFQTFVENKLPTTNLFNLSGIQTNVSVVLTFKFENDVDTQTILLNSVNDSDVDLSSTLTEYPLVSGDMAADHMFKNPMTMRLSGSFQNLSTSTIDAISSSNESSHLAKIQELFERIKNEGILCEIVKVVMPDGKYESSSPRFLKRSNMILTDISWTEKITSMSYNLNFRQVLLADVIEYDVATDDRYLPNPTDPDMKSFAANILDWSIIDATLFSTLLDFELMTDEFVSHMQSLGSTALVALGAAVATALAVEVGLAVGSSSAAAAVSFAAHTTMGTTIAGWIAAATGATVSTAGVGLIVIAVTVLAAVLVVGLISIISEIVKRAKYTVKTFKTYASETKMRKEEERFGQLVAGIHKDMVDNLDKNILVYTPSDNSEQQCILTLDNSIYTFVFIKNNTSGNWDVKILDIDDNVIKDQGSVDSCALEDFTECLEGNELFRTSASNHQVYIFKKQDSDSSDLTNYSIMYSKIEMSTFTNLIQELIKNRLTR